MGCSTFFEYFIIYFKGFSAESILSFWLSFRNIQSYKRKEMVGVLWNGLWSFVSQSPSIFDTATSALKLTISKTLFASFPQKIFRKFFLYTAVLCLSLHHISWAVNFSQYYLLAFISFSFVNLYRNTVITFLLSSSHFTLASFYRFKRKT